MLEHCNVNDLCRSRQSLWIFLLFVSQIFLGLELTTATKTYGKKEMKTYARNLQQPSIFKI